MKLFGLILLALSLSVGCAKKTTTSLPPGATSPADASTYRVLNDAHAFLQSVRNSVAAGKLTLSPTEKTTFNSLITASNAADALWETCHAGGCSTAQQQQLTAATNNLNANLAAAQSQIVMPK